MASSVLSVSAASLASKSKVVSSKVFSAKKSASCRKVSITTRATGTMVDDKTGIKKMRDGIKEAADENLLTPRFYTTGTFHFSSFHRRGWFPIRILRRRRRLCFSFLLFPVVSPGRYRYLFSRENSRRIEFVFFFYMCLCRSIYSSSTRDDEVEEDVIHGARARRGQTRENARTTDQSDITYHLSFLKKTDFDEMEQLFSTEINPNLDESEIFSILNEFRDDFNQKHFVRNDEFKKAADNIQGEQRRIFIEFLERSCTAEFSGFLLYKELGRRLKKTAPTVAEIFTLMSRDEARHAGFLNKAMSDFNLALDLGFLTKNRQYTFFKPKFIMYATYLSEKIGYWRYISIYRHLQANPDDQLYPIFKYFENWCQDENRHGDFFSAILKARPEFLNDTEAKLWSRFFCLSVYITMYLNDHSRSEFYESLGMDTTKFNMHVIHQTNKTTATIFPQVIDTYNPAFKAGLDGMLAANQKMAAISKSDDSDIAKALAKAPLLATFATELIKLMIMKPIDSGSIDTTLEGHHMDVNDPAFMY